MFMCILCLDLFEVPGIYVYVILFVTPRTRNNSKSPQPTLMRYAWQRKRLILSFQKEKTL